MAAPKRNNDRINDILDSITPEKLFGSGQLGELQASGLKIEYLPIQLVYPDPAQPRRVLPASIYQDFYGERCTPVQALKEFIRLVQVTARQKGRPFSNLTDLLPNPEDDSDLEQGKLTPEETLLRDLVILAMTIRDDGQVNALTVVDRSHGVSHVYRIETGERRYWATWIMVEFLPGYQGDATLPCIIVPHDRASVFRQAKENTSRSGLNAIALARQATLLILAVHNIHPPDGPVSNDFYRQALELDLRGKSNYTADILTALGGLRKYQLSRIKALLRLSDEALELADRFNVDESLLRYVIQLDDEFHVEMVRQIIEFNLTRKQLQELCSGEFEDETDSSEPLSKEAIRAIKLLRSGVNAEPYAIAQGLFEQEGDAHMARALVRRLKDVLDAVESYLDGS